jgi:cyclic pyranopterin phosphate synthase
VPCPTIRGGPRECRPAPEVREGLLRLLEQRSAANPAAFADWGTAVLTHVDEKNRSRMVDVGEKPVTHRTAHARAIIFLPSEVQKAVSGDEIQSKKGPVFSTAMIAGVMAAKKTSELIPLCHPLAIEGCKVDIALTDDGKVQVDCRVSLHGRTGVEMEALTGATVAALTVYDMCKALSHEIVIEEVRLVEKRGGRRDVGS